MEISQWTNQWFRAELDEGSFNVIAGYAQRHRIHMGEAYRRLVIKGLQEMRETTKKLRPKAG